MIFPIVLKKLQKNKMTKTKFNFYDSIIKYCVYAVVFLMPIFFLPFTYEMVEYNKQVLLWMFAGVVLLAWLLKIAKEKTIVFKKSWVNSAVLIFICVNILVLVFSKNIYTSLWGCHGRHTDSFLGTISLAVLFLAVVNNGDLFFKQSKGAFLKIFFGAAFISEIILLLFSFGWLNKISVFPALLNGNTLASFKEGAAVFLTVILCMKVFDICKKRDYILRKNVFDYVLLFTTLISLLVLDFKLAWMFVSIAMVILIGFFTKGFKNKTTNPISVLAPVAVAIISLLCVFNIFQIQNISFLKNINRVANETRVSSKLSLTVAKESLKTDPILAIFGSGQGNFSYNFSKFKPANFNETNLWRFKFNKASSHILELFSTTGILGILAWIVLMGSIVYMTIAKEKFKVFKNQEDSNEGVVLAFGLLILLFLQFFYNSTTLLLFSTWMFAAILIIICQKNVKNKEIKLKKLSGMFNVTVVIAAILFGFSVYKISGCYGANIYYKKAVIDPATVYEQEDAMSEAIKLDIRNYIYYVDLAQICMNRIAEENDKALLNGSDISTDGELLNLVQELFDKADVAMEKAISISPNDVKVWETQAYLELNYAGNLEKAKSAFEKAIILDPNNPLLKVELGAIFIIEENFEEAIKMFQKATDTKKDLKDAYFGLALCFEKQEEGEKALENYKKLLELSPEDEILKEKINHITREQQ